MTGYLDPLYANSFSEYSVPIYLERSKGWLLKREIQGTNYFDAMGTYPLFCCKDWDNLIADLESLKDNLVCVSFVTDPLAKIGIREFSDYLSIFYPFKDHYVLDLTQPIDQVISSGRRKDARRALRNLDIDIQHSPNIDLDEWIYLYGLLIEKHKIQGIRTFSRKSFEKQLEIPETLYFRALHEGEIVGGKVVLIQNDAAYIHLSAHTNNGYKLDAGYAITWSVINYLKNKVHWINFGGSTNLDNGELDGLAQFKKGWSSEIRKSFFCGKIYNKEQYEEILLLKGINETKWFPAYRFGEY
jgi:hypothetical protein